MPCDALRLYLWLWTVWWTGASWAMLEQLAIRVQGIIWNGWWDGEEGKAKAFLSTFKLDTILMDLIDLIALLAQVSAFLANVTKCWLSWDKSAGNLLQKRSCLTRHWSTWENWTCRLKDLSVRNETLFFFPIFLSLSLSIGKLYSYSELYSFPAFFRWLCVRMSPLYFASAPLYCAGRGWKHLWGLTTLHRRRHRLLSEKTSMTCIAFWGNAVVICSVCSVELVAAQRIELEWFWREKVRQKPRAG